MKWNIQAAESTDAERLSKITKRSKAHWGYSKEQMTLWDEELTILPDYIEENIVFNLIVDFDIVAYYSMVHMDETHIQLDNLFVLPDYIKNGLGSLLLGEAIVLAQELGYSIMLLDSDPNSTGFYEYHGFQVVGQKETSIEGRFLPIMALRLA